jgi:hypothetical protein
VSREKFWASIVTGQTISASEQIHRILREILGSGCQPTVLSVQQNNDYDDTLHRGNRPAELRPGNDPGDVFQSQLVAQKFKPLKTFVSRVPFDPKAFSFTVWNLCAYDMLAMSNTNCARAPTARRLDFAILVKIQSDLFMR